MNHFTFSQFKIWSQNLKIVFFSFFPFSPKKSYFQSSGVEFVICVFASWTDWGEAVSSWTTVYTCPVRCQGYTVWLLLGRVPTVLRVAWRQNWVWDLKRRQNPCLQWFKPWFGFICTSCIYLRIEIYKRMIFLWSFITEVFHPSLTVRLFVALVGSWYPEHLCVDTHVRTCLLADSDTYMN